MYLSPRLLAELDTIRPVVDVPSIRAEHDQLFALMFEYLRLLERTPRPSAETLRAKRAEIDAAFHRLEGAIDAAQENLKRLQSTLTRVSAS